MSLRPGKAVAPRVCVWVGGASGHQVTLCVGTQGQVQASEVLSVLPVSEDGSLLHGDPELASERDRRVYRRSRWPMAVSVGNMICLPV